MKTSHLFLLIFLVTIQAHSQGPLVANQVSIVKSGSKWKISSNGIPVHDVGRFPNPGNPNRIRIQAFQFELPANPKPAKKITWIHGDNGHRFRGPLRFGVALNGLLFDPGAAEFFLGDQSSGWQYEALSGTVPLGLDENHAHVQPTGSYHYHGIPTGLVNRLGYEEGKHSPLIGWAADGYPIYVKLGYKDPENRKSEIVELRSGYRLKKGNRPGGSKEPGGKYDGAFVKDYEFVEGLGDLDECNGRFCVTPEFPNSTYAYFLTESWPVIPRAFRGTPVSLHGFAGPPGRKGRGPKGPPPPLR